ncbi:MAG: hypothetical protein ACREMY_03335 [bacterium]
MSDCHIGQTAFGPEDVAFFESVESDVHAQFVAHGYEAVVLAKALRLRAEGRPIPRRASTGLAQDTSKVRKVALRQIDRLADSDRELAAHALALDRSRQFAESIEGESAGLRAALATAHDDIDKTRSDLDMRAGEIAVLGARTSELTATLAERTEDLSAHQDRLTRLTKELGAATEQLALRGKEIADAHANAQLQHQAFLSAREYTVNIGNELLAAKSRVDELHREMTRWSIVATDIDHHLQAVYATRSWRLTAPLRWIKQRLRRPTRAANDDQSWVAGLAKDFVARLVARSARYLQARPALKSAFVRVLARFPHHYQRLRSIAFMHGSHQPTGAVTHEEARPRRQAADAVHVQASSDTGRCSRSTLRTYRLLIAAREGSDLDSAKASTRTGSD